MIATVDKLFVLWSDPSTDGSRCVVGYLAREPSGFSFVYGPDVDKAVGKGFHLFPEFPDKRPAASPYRSGYLFPSFAQRIPHPSRPDFKQQLQFWGVQRSDDLLEILAKSGGVQLTDRVELSEFREADDALLEPLLFRVAGEKYMKGADLLSAGEKVVLQADPRNSHDPHATLVLLREGEKVGYVPRQYSALIGSHLSQHHSLESTAVRRLIVPSERGRWIISVRRARQ